MNRVTLPRRYTVTRLYFQVDHDNEAVGEGEARP